MGRMTCPCAFASGSLRSLDLTERFVRNWKRLPRAAVELLPLEVLKKYVDVTFGDMV